MKISYYRDSTLRACAQKMLESDYRGALAAKRRDAVSVSHTFSQFTRRLLDVVSPHFVVVFSSEDCDGLAQRLKALLGARLATLTTAQATHTNVSFMERFDANLTAYLSKAHLSEATVCGAVFQVLYTLAALQKRLPGFRHNDLSTNNVLVRSVPAWHGAYSIGGKEFHTHMPVFLALSDYDFAHVPGHPTLSNERILGGKYPEMSAMPNPSYDAHLFLASVARCLARSGSAVPQARAFLASLGLQPADRLRKTLQHLVPATLVRHPYFLQLRRAPEPATRSLKFAT